MSLLAACADDSDVDGFSEDEWTEIKKLSPLPDPPPDPTNKYADNSQAAKLGQSLFYDKRLAGPVVFQATAAEGSLGDLGQEGKYNCASCHDQSHYFVDTRSNPGATSLGPGGWLPRNTLSLVNAVYYEWSGWQGFIDTFWGHSVIGIEAAVGANGDPLRTSHLLYDKYRDEYNQLFDPDLPAELDPASPDAARFPASAKPKAMGQPDGPWEMMTADDRATVTQIEVNAAKTMAAYIRKLVKRNAPFDDYVAGYDTQKFDAISASAKRGLKLFIGKAACVKCHEGPFFSDEKFHNTGVPQEGLHVPAMDTGRTQGITIITKALTVYSSAGPFSDGPATTHTVGDLTAVDTDLGAFRTQDLRNIATTAPYMHTGAFTDLRSVIELYNEGGKTEGFMGTVDELISPLNLTDKEMDDLVAFLETLTGQDLPPALLQDTSAP